MLFSSASSAHFCSSFTIWFKYEYGLTLFSFTLNIFSWVVTLISNLDPGFKLANSNFTVLLLAFSIIPFNCPCPHTFKLSIFLTLSGRTTVPVTFLAGTAFCPSAKNCQ